MIHHLGEHGFFGHYNAAALREYLEGDKDQMFSDTGYQRYLHPRFGRLRLTLQELSARP